MVFISDMGEYSFGGEAEAQQVRDIRSQGETAAVPAGREYSFKYTTYFRELPHFLIGKGRKPLLH
jgi:hypothetical protein